MKTTVMWLRLRDDDLMGARRVCNSRLTKRTSVLKYTGDEYKAARAEVVSGWEGNEFTLNPVPSQLSLGFFSWRDGWIIDPSDSLITIRTWSTSDPSHSSYHSYPVPMVRSPSTSHSAIPNLASTSHQIFQSLHSLLESVHQTTLPAGSLHCCVMNHRENCDSSYYGF